MVALLLSILLISQPVPEYRYDARLIRVLDGDSFTALITSTGSIRIPGQELQLAIGTIETVRISGINTPESRGAKCAAEKKKGLEAKSVLEKLLSGKPLVLVTRGEEREKYGRLLADVEVEGKSVAQELISRGLADPYSGGKRDPLRWCGGGGA